MLIEKKVTVNPTLCLALRGAFLHLLKKLPPHCSQNVHSDGCASYISTEKLVWTKKNVYSFFFYFATLPRWGIAAAAANKKAR